MGVLLKTCLWVCIIIGPATIFPGASAVDPRDYAEAIKEDSVVEREDTHIETSTYPNGINVIPGDADTHYPIYAKIMKSAFSCEGRIPGFYADTDLRCQVWHICDETGVQQSFLCTNGTIYSQKTRVCDWWYNVNCDPEEVNRNYAANSELYKDPPPKEVVYEETSNELPHSPPAQHKRPVQQQQQQQRPQPQQKQQHQQPQRQQNYEEPEQRPQHDRRPQSYDQSQQRSQNQRPQQNYEEPQQRPQQSNERPQQQQQRPQNYDQPQQRPQNQRPQNYEQPKPQPQQQNKNYEPQQLQARKQPSSSSPQNINYVAPPQPQRPAGNPPASGTPEKKRVIVLRLPGPLPPGATIPPHILMEYAESVLAAEREGKAPPAGLVSSKTVYIDKPTQRPQHQPPPQQQRTQPPQQHRPQPQQQQHQQQQQRAPTQRPKEPQQAESTPKPRPAPKGPILPYTPRPFSEFLEAASKHNGQTKTQPKQSQPEPQNHNQQSQHQQSRSTSPPQNYNHQQQQNNNRPTQKPHQQQHHQQSEAPRRQSSPPPQQQQRRYEEPRQTPAPQQPSYDEERGQQSRGNYQEDQRRQPSTLAPLPEKKTSAPYKPYKSAPQPVNFNKYRHSTRRNHGETRFAPKSAAAYEDLEEERQVIEESRRPAYFNNLQQVAHISQTPASVTFTTQRPQPRPIKTDVHLKSSFEPVFEKKTNRYQEPVVNEKYLTLDDIIEPAIKRLVVAAGLKIKDPRHKESTTSRPSRTDFNSEEQYRNDRNYEPVRVIVARKSTTTSAPTTYYTTTTTTTTIAPQYYQETSTAPQHVRRVMRKKVRVQKVLATQPEQEPESSQPEIPQAPEVVTSRPRPTPKGPMLHYTARPFSAFLEEATRLNGQNKNKQKPQATPSQPETRPTPQPQQQKLQSTSQAYYQQNQYDDQSKQTYRPTNAPTTTYRAPTTAYRAPTTTTTTPYPYDDYYNGEPTQATKNYGFDVYGKTDYPEEEEELVRAAQEYYQASELYGVKQRY